MKKVRVIGMALAFIEFDKAVERLNNSFHESKKVLDDFKSNAPIEKTPSKYINKPRYNFKRR